MKFRQIVNRMYGRKKTLDRAVFPSEIEEILTNLENNGSEIKMKRKHDLLWKKVETKKFAEYVRKRLPENGCQYDYFKAIHEIYSSKEEEQHYMDFDTGLTKPDKRRVPMMKITISYLKKDEL